MKKRMIIHPERLSTFRKTGSVYVITCTDEFICDHTSGCGRGFYSLFIQAINGMFLSQRMNMPYYVDFGNRQYRYTDARKGEPNFWNNYFVQSQSRPDTSVSVVNYPHEVFPICVWARSYFRTIHTEVLNHLTWKPQVQAYLHRETEIFKKHKILGIHIRKTDHFNETVPASLELYLKKIDQHINRFDRLFVATDDVDVLQLLQSRYSEKIFYHQVQRSERSIAVHARNDIDNRYQLGLDALLEGYSLSFCKMAILSPSNLSYAACLFNPQLSYVLIESRQAWQKRMKSLFLYHLDRWNIRKW